MSLISFKTNVGNAEWNLLTVTRIIRAVESKCGWPACNQAKINTSQMTIGMLSFTVHASADNFEVLKSTHFWITTKLLVTFFFCPCYGLSLIHKMALISKRLVVYIWYQYICSHNSYPTAEFNIVVHWISFVGGYHSFGENCWLCLQSRNRLRNY
jgi:hypothetical protein